MVPYKRKRSAKAQSGPRKKAVFSSKAGTRTTKGGSGGTSWKRTPTGAQKYRKSTTNNNRRRLQKKTFRKRKYQSSKGNSKALSGVDASFSNARYGSGPRVYRGFKSRGNRLSFNSVVPQRFKSALGEQGVTLLPSWACRQGLTTGLATTFKDYNGLGGTVTGSLIAYMQEELRRNLPSTQWQYAGTSGTQPKGVRSAKFVIHNVTCVHELKSTSTVPIHVTLYELVLRPKAWLATSTGDPNVTFQSPQLAWDSGVLLKRAGTDHEDLLAASTPSRVPGEKPFDSPLFCRQYRVYKTTKLILSPGQTHIHKVTVRPRNMFPLYPSPDTTAGAADYIDHIPGVETYTMLVLSGTPVHQDATAHLSNNLTMSAASIDCVTKCYVNFQAFDTASKNYHQFNYLSTSVNMPRTVQEDNDTSLVLPVTDA